MLGRNPPDGRLEIPVLQGPSGVGKSLLLRAIADLDPNEGSIELDGSPRDSVPAPFGGSR